MEEKHIIVMTREWDSRRWIWRLFTDSVMPESSLQVVLDGLKASGKAFAYGEVQGCTCNNCLRAG